MSQVKLHKVVNGFVFDRLQGSVLREAYCLVRDGVVNVDDVDRVLHDGTGLCWAAVCPFETVSLITRSGIERNVARTNRGRQNLWPG